MFWCVADFSVCPHGQMLGIVLWQPLIGVRHHALAALDWRPASCSGNPNDCHLAFELICSGLQSVDGC